MQRVSRMELVVEFRGCFPIAMLRRDACIPKSEDDSTKIQLSLNQQGLRESYRVMVMRISDRDEPWREEVWESFGGRVVTSRSVEL